MTNKTKAASMSSEEIINFVSGRLEGNVGPAINRLHDEPVWAVLLSNFLTWRIHYEQLAALDAALLNTWRSALQDQKWSVVQAVCEFACAIATTDEPWFPSSRDKWKLLIPLNDPPASAPQARAFIAIYQLAVAWPEQVSTDSRRTLLKGAYQLATEQKEPWRAEWVLACWEVMLRDPQSMNENDWYELWQTVATPNTDYQSHLAKRALRWAWLATDKKENLRAELMRHAIKTIRDLDAAHLTLREKLDKMVIDEFNTSLEIVASAREDLAEVSAVRSHNCVELLRTPNLYNYRFSDSRSHIPQNSLLAT